MMLPLDDQVLTQLAASPRGLSAPELRRRVQPSVSQPTLWRALDRLRAAGRVIAAGRARATHYHAAEPTALAVLRSRALHRAVASTLARQPERITQVRTRLAHLRTVNPHGAPYHDRWEALLAGPLPALLRALHEESESADTLRKESPFTTLVPRAQRDRLFRSIRGA
jgi:hypothetical protein